jgi:DNA-binding response OmpR family regulator
VSDRAISNELKDGTKNKITMAKKILIVDDEAHIRMLIEQTLEELEDEGVEFLTADNGATALDIIQSETPELVFLDVMMPKMNGMEVCRRVKKELVIDNVFIVLLTAKGQELDRQKGQEVGADVYMTKPFDPEAILNKARTVLELN